MVTQTIYADASMVVIDIGGAAPATAEWLAETTYLIDASGHTTAMYAQTDEPTLGVQLQPVPYTPVEALVTAVLSSTLTLAKTPPSPAPSATRLANPTLSTAVSVSASGRGPKPFTIALAAVGVIIGVFLMAVIVHALHRRRNRSRSNTREDLAPFVEDTTTDSSSSQNSMEQHKNGPWPLRRMATWEDFLQEVEKEYERIDESEMTSEGSKTSMGGYHATTAELEERYNRLLSKSNRPPIRPVTKSSATTVASSAESSPLSMKQSSQTHGNHSEKNNLLVHAGQPLSILKRPARKRLAEAIQGMWGSSSTEGSYMGHGPSYAWKEARVIKKGVRFGSNEIRVFGATPLPSRANSISREGNFSREGDR
ncbi:hypothetical protein N7G274_004025 [Stereocaulon virgatum]|uniref:Transmembrane protein n=1 Tax=Stereocaulon virgatum TaxID=373712 RepID=A0ABR4AAS1_9LECA